MATVVKNRQNEIDRAISDMLFSLNLSYPQSNILDIIKALGIEVYSKDFSQLDKGSQIRGFIDDRGETTKIYINSNDLQSRKNFTLAHELGHYILHKSKLLSGNKYYLDTYNYGSQDQDSLEETEANYFAASLLVPKKILIDALLKGGKPYQIAEYFGVSESVIKKRIEWIKSN